MNEDRKNREKELQQKRDMVKQRRESITMYEQGGRAELAQQEREEIEVIEGFLPKQFDEGETREAIAALITELGATGVKDMGKVIAALKQRPEAGSIDFSSASKLVQAKLP